MKLRKCFKQNVYVLIKMLSKEFMYKKANWKSINEKSTAYVSTVKDCCHSAISESNKHLGNKVINQELKKEYKRLVLTQLNNETGNTKEYLKLLHTTKCNNSDLENNTTKYVDAFMKEVKNSYKNLQVLSSQNIIIDSSSKNYILDDSDQIYMSMKQKFDKNINALTLIKDIESRHHNATEEEQKILVQYSGFGGLSIIFNENDEKGRPKDRETLKSIVTKEEYKELRSSTLNAHYTPKHIIDAIYKILSHIGVKGGNILEPAAGIGHFIGSVPESWNVNYYGVELDPLTGEICKQLYPEANIQINAFEKSSHKVKYDLAISNVPFGAYSVFDPEYNKYNLYIHDYFIVKALDNIRENGILAVITTKGTMDKKNSKARELISEKATLIGAIRLPSVAFKITANTEVTTDILFFKKGLSKDTFIPFEKTVNVDGYAINEYFNSNPHMMLGTMTKNINMYGGDNTTLEACSDWVNKLDELYQHFPNDTYEPLAKTKKITTDLQVLDKSKLLAIPEDMIVKEYQYTLIDQIIYQCENKMLHKVDVTGKKYDRLVGLIKLRIIAIDYINKQSQKLSDYGFTIIKNNLNTHYDLFVRKNGYINNRTNMSLFREDPDFPLLLALEIEDEDKFKKADMFFKRTIYPEIEITSADNSEDALTISLNRLGKVDLDYMSKLTGTTCDQLIDELSGNIFYDPQENAWVDDSEYLSGNVREKLKTAKELTIEKVNLSQNIIALEEVQLKDLEAHEINVKLGSPWVPTDVIRDFISELLDVRITDTKVNYSSVIATWDISVIRANYTKQTKTYGTRRLNAIDLILKMLNQQEIKIFDLTYEDGKERRVLNKNETLAARHKKEQIETAFGKWIYEDIDRRNQLTKKYNYKFNCIRERSYKGTVLTYPGMNKTIQLRSNQAEAIERIVFTGNTILAHKVGAGKTFTVCAACMKLRQTGLAKKPMIVVPNHLINQWGAEFMRLYPTAKILAATKADFQKKNRKRLFGRIATGDWDAIIIAHSSFKMINVNEANLKAFIQKQIDAIEESILAAMEIDNYSGIVRRLETTKKRLDTEMEKLMNQEKKDTDFLTFEKIGVDSLFIDESQAFKNLYTYTKMGNVSGIPQTKSQKAFDLFMKSQYIIEKFGQGKRGLVFATGTPLSNSMVEMYTLQRYMQLSTLEHMGLAHFDSWAAQFGESVTALEISPDGSGYRMKTRFRKFNNLPELMSMFKQFADIRTGSMLDLPIPKLKNGKATIIECEPSEELIAFIDTLVERTELIKNGSVDPRDDNLLKIISEAKKASLSLSLICPDAKITNEFKVVKAAKEIYVRFKLYEKQKLTQLVFCDLSTPNKDKFNVYDDLKSRLIEKGIPENEIAFIHDANTDKQKERLFKKVNAGIVRVIIGSTPKLGAGTNIQEKMCCIHHLDVPWRPSDIEQRDGRLLRPGNTCLELNIEVEKLVYITKKSFDSFSWQTLETKAKFIDQIMSGDLTLRSMDDIDSTSLNYAEIKAIASGNPLILEKMQVDSEIHKLSVLESMYIRDKYRTENQLASLPQLIEKLKRRIHRYEQDILKYMATTSYSLKVFTSTFSDEKEAGQVLKDLSKIVTKDSTEIYGEYMNFELHMYKCTNSYEDHYTVISLVNPDTGSEHKVEVSQVAIRNIERLDNIIRDFDKELFDAKEKLDIHLRSYDTMKEEVKKPFEKKARLNELLEKQREIDAKFDKDKDDEMIIEETS